MGSIFLVLSPTLGMLRSSDLSDMDDINEAINNELLSLSIPWSGEGDGNQGSGSFGLSNVYCGLGLLGASVVMVDGQNQHPQGCPLWGNLLDG